MCAVRRRIDELAPLVNEITQSGVGSIKPFGVDCRKEEDVVALVKNVEENVGPIEVMVTVFFRLGIGRKKSPRPLLQVHNIGANIGYLSALETTSNKYAALAFLFLCFPFTPHTRTHTH